MKWTVIALATSCLVSPASAESGNADGANALVERFLSDVATLSANFEQTLEDADGEVLEVTSGSLEIRRPGRFRWAYERPYEQVLVADGTNIWSYDVDLAQVTVKPQADALSNTPALLLGGSSDAMDQFEFAGSESRDGITWVSLAPKKTDSGFRRVDMGFAGSDLSRMVFLDNLEQRTTVVLSGLNVNGPLPDSSFVFEVPEDADLVGTPAAVVTP